MGTPELLRILEIVLLVVSTGHLVYWACACVQYARTLRDIPSGTAAAARYSPIDGRKGLEFPPPGNVCVVVPAHNEEACIEKAARSLLAQNWPGLRIVFALDRCTDQTEALLRGLIDERDQHNCEILRIDRCPDDWTGKSHAIWRAVHDSAAGRGADVLVFVDADTELDPRCIRACIGLLQERCLSLLSLLSTLSSNRLFERVAQPAAVFELMRQFPIRRANSPDGKRPFANGQFIMVRRADYIAFGGHEAIRWAVLEDVELARQANRHKFRTGLFIANELLSCRMYERLDDFAHGWKRIFRESCNNRPARLREFAWRLRLQCTVLPALVLAGAALGMWVLISGRPELESQRCLSWWTAGICGAGVVVWGSLVAACYRSLDVGARWAWAFPIGAWQVGGIMLQAAREQAQNVPIRWGGREYQRPARSSRSRPAA
jgi:chlorobactene glucosyltransferase